MNFGHDPQSYGQTNDLTADPKLAHNIVIMNYKGMNIEPITSHK